MERSFQQHRQLIHTPALLEETLDSLNVRPGGVYLDATVGAGGHAAAIAKRLKTGLLIGLDRDLQTLDQTRKTLAPFGEKIRLHQANFVQLQEILNQEAIAQIDGALFDLGVSSMQLDHPQRGFSFRRDGPLDMRMGSDAPRTAAQLIEQSSAAALEHIIRSYGEERFARRIAQAITQHRENHGPLSGTEALADLIANSIPAPARRKAKIHPATRTFQALRIAVNDELNAIPIALEAAFLRLRPDGRLVVISFHSLEDRLVKQFFREKAQGCTCPPGLPQCVCGKQPDAKLFPLIRPSERETKINPRVRSARLRVGLKLK